jgi:hypothetical protein
MTLCVFLWVLGLLLFVFFGDVGSGVSPKGEETPLFDARTGGSVNDGRYASWRDLGQRFGVRRFDFAFLGCHLRIFGSC